MRLGERFFRPRGFLKWAGIILTVIGALGTLGILRQSFWSAFWVDLYSGIAYLALGLFALCSIWLYRFHGWIRPYYRRIVQAYGVIALIAGLYAFLVFNEPAPNVLGLWNVEVTEALFLLLLATWAFAAGYYGEAEAPTSLALNVR